MRINEHFEELEKRIAKLEKEVKTLKADKTGKAEKPAGETSKAKKTTGK